MKQALFWIPAFCAMALSLSNCVDGGGASAHNDPNGSTVGPFDPVTGQYVEAWADDPSKWRRRGGSPHATKTQPPQIAKNDEVPMDSIPLAPSHGGGGKPGSAAVGSRPVAVTPLPPAGKSKPVVIRDTPKPTVRVATNNDGEPKKKVVAKAKPTTKPKPKTQRYTVKKGDSLSAIASRTGASVSAIKSANGISGTLIRPGQSLVIPRR